MASKTADWAWFTPLLPRIESAIREATLLLAQTYLAENAWPKAYTLAGRALSRDPCDERACEIAILALRGAGDPLGAVRLLNRYDSAVRAEFGAWPATIILAGRIRIVVAGQGRRRRNDFVP